MRRQPELILAFLLRSFASYWLTKISRYFAF